MSNVATVENTDAWECIPCAYGQSHATSNTKKPDKFKISRIDTHSSAKVPDKIVGDADPGSCSMFSRKFTFIVVCKTCWSLNGIIEQYIKNENLAKCSQGHDWISNQIVLEVTADRRGKKVIIKPLPNPKLKEFKMCSHNNSINKCQRVYNCTFAHHVVECEVWKWQVLSSPPGECSIVILSSQI